MDTTLVVNDLQRVYRGEPQHPEARHHSTRTACGHSGVRTEVQYQDSASDKEALQYKVLTC